MMDRSTCILQDSSFADPRCESVFERICEQLLDATKRWTIFKDTVNGLTWNGDRNSHTDGVVRIIYYLKTKKKTILHYIDYVEYEDCVYIHSKASTS